MGTFLDSMDSEVQTLEFVKGLKLNVKKETKDRRTNPLAKAVQAMSRHSKNASQAKFRFGKATHNSYINFNIQQYKPSQVTVN